MNREDEREYKEMRKMTGTVAEQRDADRKPKSEIRAAMNAFLVGHDWDFIADRFQFASPTSAKRAVMKFMGSAIPADGDTVASGRMVVKGQLDMLLQAAMPRALKTTIRVTDDDGNETALLNEDQATFMKESRELLKLKAALLGLNAPTVHAHIAAKDGELQDIVENLQRLRNPQDPEGDILEMSEGVDGTWEQEVELALRDHEDDEPDDEA